MQGISTQKIYILRQNRGFEYHSNLTAEFVLRTNSHSARPIRRNVFTCKSRLDYEQINENMTLKIKTFGTIRL